ncbi:protein FAR1-RELATED SEQUENCE 9-like [Arachis hypogaea]|uniref:protein FAR1-RELATED SEQUENCE 9-like n=1 Tax=Arachis hypogaea TaxID=3818 RepID=UPI000DEDA1B2|nr:protein FAR1-RELATED SEQUENCE 9-like [Arachis hypogaea]
MACKVVQSLCHVPSSILDHNPSKPPEEAPEHFFANGQQPNKAMPRLDVTEDMPLLDLSQVGSEKMDHGHQVPDHDGLRENEIPCVGMRFEQLQMAHEFYVTYTKKVGFATKIRTTTCAKITNQPINQAIHYNRNGFRVSRVKAEEHDLSRWVQEKDLRNYITAKLRTSNVNVDVREMMNYFMRMKDINPNFFYAVNLDDKCKFRSAVWVDARCRASYEYYGDVVSLDSTYNTNKHGLPFASFVGVNHHGKSTILGCALFGNEEISSYEWVFRRWVKCMGTAPQRIITDQCKSIFRAIKNVLPDTRHQWCIWHITKKLPHKLGGYRRYRELYDEFNDIVWNSRTEQSFEDNWYEFIDEHNLHNNTWLSDLFDDRRMWVPIFFKGEFWTAMRSTQRSESMHSFYGNFLHSRTSLVQFVHEYDNVLGIKEQRELEDDAADSRGVIPCATTSPMERQFQQEYTICMFRDVQIEFVKKANCRVSVVAEEGPVVCMKVEEEKLVNDSILCVPYDIHFDRSTQEVRCECNLFESSRVLCCHCLEVFHSYKVYKVPNRYVLLRWSKNTKRKHTYVKSSHNVSRSDESHVAFKGLCAHFYNIAQDFVNDDEETALLHAALEETRAKLTAHRVKKRYETVADSHNNNGSTSSNVAAVMDIQAPSKVRAGQRSTQDVRFGGVVGQADPEQVGGFMSLLSSFSKS